MSKPSKSEIKRLEALWYKKLKDQGFVDIEHADGSINSSKPHAMRTKDTLYVDSIREYYSMATAFLHDHTFKNELEKVIWEYHTEGLSSYQIAGTLKKIGFKNRPTQIQVKIRRLVALMKARYLSA